MPKIAKRNGARLIRRSAHDIWLAGLGALALAEEEGGKLFKALVKRGSGIEAKNKDRFDQLIARAKPVREDARAALSRVAHGVDDSLAMVLHRVGVPTRKEIQGLTKRVEELTHHLERPRPRHTKPVHHRRSATSPVV